MKTLKIQDYAKTFPHGETMVSLEGPPQDKESIIDASTWSGDNDTMIILQIADILKRNYKNPHIELFLPYLPYGRQDRATTDTTAHSLAIFARMLNSFDFYRIETWDAHSEISAGLIHNLEVIPNKRYIENVLKDFDDPLVISPDEGASKKIRQTLKDTDVNYIQGEKTRDPGTGKITDFKVDKLEEVKDRDLLIVDDICSMGGTFLGLKEVLLSGEPNSISLAVTHYDGLEGQDRMLQNFEKVYATTLHKVYNGILTKSYKE